MIHREAVKIYKIIKILMVHVVSIVSKLKRELLNGYTVYMNIIII